MKADLLGYLWSSSLRPLTSGLNFEKKKTIAELALHRMDDCVEFSRSERNINTKANLNFDVLKDIGETTKLELTKIQEGLGLVALETLVKNLEEFAKLSAEVLNQDTVNLLLSEAISSVKSMKQISQKTPKMTPVHPASVFFITHKILGQKRIDLFDSQGVKPDTMFFKKIMKGNKNNFDML